MVWLAGGGHSYPSPAFTGRDGCQPWPARHLTLALLSLRDGAYLLHHAQSVVVRPALHDLASREAVYGDARYPHMVAGGRGPHEITLMRTAAGPARHHPIPLSYLVLYVDVSVGEGAAVEVDYLLLSFGTGRDVGEGGVVVDVILGNDLIGHLQVPCVE